MTMSHTMRNADKIYEYYETPSVVVKTLGTRFHLSNFELC